MVSERALIEQNLSDSQFKRSSVNTIPHDNENSRQAFKCVPGMAKYLEKQYTAMIRKEEEKMVKYNLGKNSAQKKTLHQFIKPDFAYANANAPVDPAAN